MKRRRFFLTVLGFLLISSTVSLGQAFGSSSMGRPSVTVTDRYGTALRSSLTPQQTYQQWVSLDRMSVWLLQASVAVEDRRFYRHYGIDPKAILRALWQNIKAGRVISGASTITQQVVRMQYSTKKNMGGKLKEAFLALYWDYQHSKEEILEQYLNSVSLGNLTQGVQAASLYYFAVPAKEVSLAQAALLVGLIQAPTRLNPLQNPQGALEKRNKVLQAMKQVGAISSSLYEMALAEPLGVECGDRPFQAPHFVRRLLKDAPSGTVESTLDKDLQLYAENSLRNHLTLLKDNHVTNGAVVVLDNTSGEVLAYVGSADFFDTKNQGQVDGVSAKRQPGSALKPFVYGLAMQHGLTAASLLKDEDTFFDGGYRPRNYDERFHGAVTVRKALANSYNVPVIKAAEPLGAGAILEFLHEFGFHSLSKPADFYGLGLALGGGEVTLLELANAYATLARGGIFRPVVFAKNPLISQPTTVKRVLPETISYILTDILADNAARADAFGLNSPLNFPFAAASKTGTSKDYKDNFAIGYTPRITVAVWVGNFDAASMQKVSGISGAAPVLRDVLSYAQTKYPGGEFARPYDVISALVCQETALLAGPECRHVKEELFVQDTQPKTYCRAEHEPAQTPLHFVFPAENDIFNYDPSLPPQAQQILLQVSKTAASCEWKINGQPLAENDTEVWFALKEGEFEVQVVCAEEIAHTHFKVL